MFQNEGLVWTISVLWIKLLTIWFIFRCLQSIPYFEGFYFCLFIYIIICGKQEIGSLTFDKDDRLAKEFVIVVANIRMSSFGISLHSFFEAKDIVVEKCFLVFRLKYN